MGGFSSPSLEVYFFFPKCSLPFTLCGGIQLFVWLFFFFIFIYYTHIHTIHEQACCETVCAYACSPCTFNSRRNGEKFRVGFILDQTGGALGVPPRPEIRGSTRVSSLVGEAVRLAFFVLLLLLRLCPSVLEVTHAAPPCLHVNSVPRFPSRLSRQKAGAADLWDFGPSAAHFTHLP